MRLGPNLSSVCLPATFCDVVSTFNKMYGEGNEWESHSSLEVGDLFRGR